MTSHETKNFQKNFWFSRELMNWYVTSFFNMNYKIILVGESGVGKTSMNLRYVYNQFNFDTTPTTASDYFSKILNIDNSKIKLSIWDTAGQECYRAITQNFYRNTNGAMLVYDISKRRTFEQIPYWYNSFTNYAGGNSDCVLIGNKSDLDDERAVSSDEVYEFAEKIGIEYFETSSKSRQNIEEVFYYLANKIHHRLKDIPVPIEKPIVSDVTVKKKCC